MSENIILETRDLHYTYPDGTHALKGINMAIRKGRKIAVLGSNGSGKSTLFLTFNGILKPQKGGLLFKGNYVRYNRAGLSELRKRIGIVFQDPDAQLFSASVHQEVSFGAMNLKLPEDVVRRRVDDALRSTGIPHLKSKATHFLSYGEKKRVCIADILVMEPEVIMFDEPTSCLDAQHTLQIMDVFNRLHKGGTTLIMSTHDVEVAWNWADEVFIMKEGVVAGVGRPHEVFSDEKLLQDTGLEKPLVMKVFEQLTACGIIRTPGPPRTEKEFFEIMASLRLNKKAGAI